MQTDYCSTGSNHALSYAQKQEIINLICFLAQKMNKKDPEKYPSCISVLSAIFKTNLNCPIINETISNYSPINYECVQAFGRICDDLLWGTHDEIPNPENISNIKEIKDKIINYFTEEWNPF